MTCRRDIPTHRARATSSDRCAATIDSVLVMSSAATTAPVVLSGAEITFAGVGVRARDGWAPRALDVVCVPGTITVLTGPNGSGKSTALAALMGLVRLDAGVIVVDGHDFKVAFTIVATLFLGACFFGWRLLALAKMRRRRSTSAG